MNIDISVFGKVEKPMLGIIVILLALLAWLNWQLALVTSVIVLGILLFIGKRASNRRSDLKSYLENMTDNIDQTSNYALQNLPTAIVIIDGNGNICWSNSVFRDWLGGNAEKTQRLSGAMPALRVDKIWGKSGYIKNTINGHDYRIIYKYIKGGTAIVSAPSQEEPKKEGFMALYFDDISDIEKIRKDAEAALPVFAYIVIDNIEDITKGLSDIERTNMWAEVNNIIVEEIDKLEGFVRSYSDDSYIACISRAALEDMIAHNFPILDRVRAIHTPRRMPITISMGVATEEPSMKEQAERAMAGLDLALGRGGDQASVYIGSDVRFYGGKTQSAEKNTRVRARVVAQAIRELILDAGNIIVMGHAREDYDSIGGAIGVAVMAKADKKKVHVVVSNQAQAIEKFKGMIPASGHLEDLLITPEEAEALTADDTLVFVVDVHRPDMVAAPKALAKSQRRVVIDHHRRASEFIAKPLLTYLEPSSSSTSELVTELIQYYTEGIVLDELEASVLYAGIVVDTKNFIVQTGSRTFDAASFLRRSGANLDIVRKLFMETFTMVQKEPILLEKRLVLKNWLLLCVRKIRLMRLCFVHKQQTGL